MIVIPSRPGKPRLQGMSQVLDKGMDLQRFTGLLEDHAPLIDVIKFGWGTALVTPCIRDKVALCRRHGITPVLGGTLLEYCLLTDQFDAFCRFLDDLELTAVEVSNGAAALAPQQVTALVRQLGRDRQVFHEVGYKALNQADAMSLQEWIRQIEAGLEAGASLIILEARESGRSGFCGLDGQPRPEFCHTFLERYGVQRVMFEAPTAALQSTLIKAHGNQLNLANINPEDIVSLETMRLGLRFDNLAQFTPTREVIAS